MNRSRLSRTAANALACPCAASAEPRASRCDSICISVAIDDCIDCWFDARLSRYTMNAARTRNMTVSTPSTWNCLTTGRLPISSVFDGVGAAVLAARNCSITDIVVSGS